MNTEQHEQKNNTAKETKEKFFQFACDEAFLELLAALAKKHRASKAHVARHAIFQLAEKEAVSI